MTPAPEAGSLGHAIAGSFRDPSGHVFRRGDGIYRAIDGPCEQVLRNLQEKGLLAALVDEGTLVATEFVAEPTLRQALAEEDPGFEHFLQHEVISPITFPYEWCISMLADAGVLTLDLQIRLLASGFSLKDASAYNIQFVRGRPKFIDLSSIERPQRLDVWFALGQFSQMFTFPLLLCRHHGWDLRSYFLASLAGRTAEQVLRGLGWLERLRPRTLLDVTLPSLFTRWAERSAGARRELLEKRRDDSGPQVLNLKRLRSKTKRLAASYKPRSVWSEYADRCNYSDSAEAAKKMLVRRFIESTRPERVLDLGCNTGEYSRLSAACGAEVIAVDADHDAVELLYRDLRAHPAPITPLVADISNPSPGIGFLNREREPLLERIGADCVLALALLHHLLVSGNLPLAAVRDLLFRLTRRHLVLEFVPTDDNLFQRLMKFRVNLFGDLTLERCRQVFCERFHLLGEEPISGSRRTLLFLQKAVDGTGGAS